MAEYKYKIDKDLLTNFLLLSGDPTKEQLKELDKVITVVMIKHYNRYFYDKEELYQYARLAVLDRRKNYDPSFSSYTYIYTICRNEIGNRIRKLTKETFVEDILPIYNASVPGSDVVELPVEIRKFRKHLTGELEFSVVDITRREAINLCSFIWLNSKPIRSKVPSFLESSKDSVKILYKLLLEL